MSKLLRDIVIQVVTGTFVPTYTFAPKSESGSESTIGGTFAPWNFCSLEHWLPNAKSKTWSFRSPCFKCVFWSKVTRIASSMLNRMYRSSRLMTSHQSHETVPSRNRSRRNQGRRHAASQIIVHRVLCQKSNCVGWPVSCLNVACALWLESRYIST